MVEPIFRPPPVELKPEYIRVFAAHYVWWKKDPRIRVRTTSKRLGLPKSTGSDALNAVESYFASPLFERDRRGITGYLTEFGQLVGAYALRFSVTDYLLRNASGIGDLGDFWAQAFAEDLRGPDNNSLFQIASLLDGPPVDVLAEDAYEDDSDIEA